MRLKIDREDVEPQPYRIRVTSGQVRGPLSVRGIKALVDVGLVDHTTQIAGAGEENWIPISEHEIWSGLRSAVLSRGSSNASGVGESNSNPSFDVLKPAETPLSRTIVEQIEFNRHKELAKTSRSLAFWRVSKLLRLGREALVVTLFLTLGDFIGSFVPPDAAVVRWGAMLSLLVLALGYYTFRAMED
jgi:hypothetical protein